MRYLKAGNILRVNLSTGEVSRTPTAKYDEDFVGGRGVQVKILYDEVGPEVDPMGPDNLLMFGTGPFTGTLIPGTGRTEVTAKSPVTGVIGMSNFGGYFATSLKYSGHDHLVIKGKAEKPVYIFIDNDKVEIRDASHLWGKDCYDTPSMIRKELNDPSIDIACIGQAGENLVTYSTIQTKIGDAAGRTGMGCVMGGKNLKAVAIRGTKGVQPANPDAFFEAAAHAQELMRNTALATTRQGDVNKPQTAHAFSMDEWGKMGMVQTKNFRETQPELSVNNPLEGFAKQFKPKQFGCFACPAREMDMYDVPGHGASVTSCMMYIEGNWKTGLMEKDPIHWWDTVLKCQKSGLDPASMGNMIGWAMELWEKGIINEKDTGGITLEWGNADSILKLIDQIIAKEGFGAILAENPFNAIKKLGKKEAGQYLMHVKGNPLFNWNALNVRQNALTTSVGNRGDLVRGQNHTDNLIGRSMAASREGRDPDPIGAVAKGKAKVGRITGNPEDINQQGYNGKATLGIFGEDVTCVTDLLLECKWHTQWIFMNPMTVEEQATLLKVGSGENWDADRLIEAAHRTIALERAYNAREGMTRAQDMLPERFFSKTPQPGFFKDDILEKDKFLAMQDEYYTLRGWDVATGIPTEDTLKALRLEAVAEDLKKRGKLPKAQPVAVPVGAEAQS